MKNINELINNDVLRGRKIFPCKPNEKRPLTQLTPHGHKDASSDVGVIETWWNNYPSKTNFFNIPNVTYQPYSVNPPTNMYFNSTTYYLPQCQH